MTSPSPLPSPEKGRVQEALSEGDGSDATDESSSKGGLRAQVEGLVPFDANSTEAGRDWPFLSESDGLDSNLPPLEEGSVSEYSKELFCQPGDNLKREVRQRQRFCDGVTEDVLLSLSRSERARQEAIFELIATETNYVADLHLIEEHFIAPLLELDILSKDEIYAVFINWRAIIPINEAFCLDLRACQSETPVVNDVSHILMSHMSHFDAYVEYCSKHSFAMKRVGEYSERSERFRDFLAETKKGVRETLQGYLVKPFQRLTRYPMLLQAILKNTPKDHSSRFNLTLAWNDAKNLALRANAQLQLEEERAFAVEVWKQLQQSQCADSLLQASSLRLFQRSLDNSSLGSEQNPMSRVMFSGRAQMIRNGTFPFEGHVYLFNDCLFLVKGREERSFTPVQRIPVQDLLIVSQSNKTESISDRKLSVVHGKPRGQRSIGHSEREARNTELEKHTDSVLILQSWWRMKGPRTQFFQRQENSRKALLIFQKLDIQEGSFSKRFSLLWEMMDPLCNNDDLRVLFVPIMDAQKISKNSKTFSTNLALVVNDWNHQQRKGVGTLFNLWIRTLPFFRTYLEGLVAIESALCNLHADSPELNDLIHNTERSKRLIPDTFYELLKLPSQQIAAYEEIMRGLISTIPVSHPDNALAKSTKEAIDDLHLFAKTSSEKSINTLKMRQAQARLSGIDISQEGRVLVREGTLEMLPDGTTKHLFLFSDILIVAEAPLTRSEDDNLGEKLKIRNQFKLSDISVIDLNDLYFQVVELLSNRVLLFKTPRNIFKRRWVKELGDGISQNSKPSKKTCVSSTLFSALEGAATGELSRRNTRAKRTNSNPLEDPRMGTVELHTRSDRWILRFPDNQKNALEFTEKVTRAISAMSQESLEFLTKRMEPFSFKEKEEQALGETQKHFLVPLAHSVTQAARKAHCRTLMGRERLQLMKQRAGRIEMQTMFLASQILQRPECVLSVPPITVPFFAGSPSPTRQSNRFMNLLSGREKGASLPRRAGALLREASDPAPARSTRPSLSSNKSTPSQLVVEVESSRSIETELTANTSRMEMIESQNEILTQTLVSQTKKIKKLEDLAEQLQSHHKEQQATIQALQESLSKLTKDHEREKKKRRASRLRTRTRAKVSDGSTLDDQDKSQISLDCLKNTAVEETKLTSPPNSFPIEEDTLPEEEPSLDSEPKTIPLIFASLYTLPGPSNS